MLTKITATPGLRLRAREKFYIGGWVYRELGGISRGRMKYGEDEMKWSSWKNIDEPSGYNNHAVYEVRLVNEQGTVVAINRFFDREEEGILFVGMTTDMERRRKQFISGEERCQAHSEGNLLFLLKKYSRFKTKYSKPKYQYRFQKVNTKDDAKKKERKLIKDYVKRYGEVPPLNSAIPSRLDEMSWDD